MQLVDVANLATSITLVSTSLIPIIIVLFMKTPKDASLRRGVRVTRISTLLLGSFLLTHGLYHVAEFARNDFYSDDILQPVSISILLAFSVFVRMYMFVPRPRKMTPDILTAQTRPIRKGASSPSHRSIFPILFLPAMMLLDLPAVISGNASEIYSLGGIIASTGLFGWMAVSNPSRVALHFQFAIIVLIWSAAEIPRALSIFGLISLGGIDLWGTWVHFLSMLMIGAFICVRMIKIAMFSPRMYDPSRLK